MLYDIEYMTYLPGHHLTYTIDLWTLKSLKKKLYISLLVAVLSNVTQISNNKVLFIQ